MAGPLVRLQVAGREGVIRTLSHRPPVHIQKDWITQPQTPKGVQLGRRVSHDQVDHPVRIQILAGPDSRCRSMVIPLTMASSWPT